MATRDPTQYEQQVAAIIEQTLNAMVKTDLTVEQIVKRARENAQRDRNGATTIR
jgi:ABC-type glycerol-3-phosphate transport system substrate-binding protein